MTLAYQILIKSLKGFKNLEKKV